jgi:selenide,water dikinase
MLQASGVAAEVEASAIPLLPGTLELAEREIVPGGTLKNLAYLQPHVDWGELSRPERLVLVDAQTSGGLLMVAAEERAEHLRRALGALGVRAAEIGRTVAGAAGRISVRERIPSG